MSFYIRFPYTSFHVVHLGMMNIFFTMIVHKVSTCHGFLLFFFFFQLAAHADLYHITQCSTRSPQAAMTTVTECASALGIEGFLYLDQALDGTCCNLLADDPKLPDRVVRTILFC
jgi:hypothetical protein